MVRIFLESAQVVINAKGGQCDYHAPAVYNLDDDLAGKWIADGVAFPVDDNDDPIRSPAVPVSVPVEKRLASIVFTPDPETDFAADDDSDEEI